MTAVTTTRGQTGIDAQDHSPRRPDPRYVPLVVGVAGHRDLSHVGGGDGLGALRKSVRDVLEALQGEYRATPLIVLSSLADGADRLVARVALELGICLVVPLPMPRNEYTKTFRDQESIAEFDHLCNQAARVFEVAGPSSSDAVAAYERAAGYIARNCHVLVALWDGDSSQERPGGTSQIVQFMRKGVPSHLDPRRSLLESPATGPVCHIHLPRSEHAVRAAGAEPIEWLDPAGTPRQPWSRRLTAPGSFLDGIRRSMTSERRSVWKWTMANPRSAFSKKRRLIGEFNAEVERNQAALGKKVADSKSWLLPAAELDRLQKEDTPLWALVERYAIADALAIHFQKWLLRYLVGILVLAGAVGCLFQAHVRLRLVYPIQEAGGPSWYTRSIFATNLLDPFDRSNKNLVGLANYDLVYIGFVVLIFGVYYVVRNRDDQRRYQDYRALAEGLRVQIYWRLAGLIDSVADHYLRKQRSELDWIRGALRDREILDEVSPPPGDEGVACERLRLVREHWVKDQWKFFVGIRRGNPGPRPWPWEWLRAVDVARDYDGKARARLDERRALVASRLDFVLIACVFFAYAIARAFAGPQHLVIISLVVLVLILALLGVYAKIRAFSAHAKQYARMGTFFQNAHHYLDKMLAAGACDLPAARDLIRELGEEALVENGDWVLLHREKPVELPRT